MKGFICAIDVSSVNVSVVISRINTENKFEILGKGQQSAVGYGKSVYDDVTAMADAMAGALYIAKRNAGVEISEAYISFSGDKTGLFEILARRDYSEGERLLEKTDVVHILSSGYDYPVNDEAVIIDVIARKFFLDDNTENLDFPEGRNTSYVEASMGLAAADNVLFEHIESIVNTAGIKPVGYALTGYCTGYSVLTPEERDKGIILLNIGLIYTDICVFMDGTPIFCVTMPVGNNDITRDISSGLNTTYSEAEDIRKKYGLAAAALIDDDHKVPVNTINGGTSDIMLSDIIGIVENRIKRIFEVAATLIYNENFGDSEPKNVVLTGPGAASTEGAVFLCKSVMNKSARIGHIYLDAGGRIENAASVGLARYVYENIQLGKKTVFAELIEKEQPKEEPRRKPFWKRFGSKK